MAVTPKVKVWVKVIFNDPSYKYAIIQQHGPNTNKLRLCHRVCGRGTLVDTRVGTAICGSCKSEITDHMGITSELDLDAQLMDEDLVSIWVRVWLEVEPEQVRVSIDR